MSLELYLAYIAATLAVCLTPGPAVLLCSSQALAKGPRAGMLAAAGVQTANACYWLVFILGLGAVIAASELAFSIIKYAGAAYLIFLGVTTIINARCSAESVAHAKPTAIWQTPFVQGFVNQLANPKAMLFMLVLVPQFVTPGRTTLLDFAAMAAAATILDFLCLSAYGWLAAKSGALLRDPVQIIWRERFAGAAQIAVGGMIAFMRRAA